MGIREDLGAELESTLREYRQLVESVPEELYGHPSANPPWTIGDILYHITLGPAAIRLEIWLIRYAPWLISTLLNHGTSSVFNWGNALFARHPKRISPQTLIRSYERGHTGLLESMGKMKEADFGKSVLYPEAFVAELAGEVTVERLFRYIRLHFDLHASQIRERVV